MKKLLLIRHAEAVSHAKGGDFARPLSDQGKQDAVKTAVYLKSHGFVPESMVISPALRTATTAQIIADHLHLSSVSFNDDIYEASEKVLLKVINSWNNQQNFMAMVGHNPGIAYLSYNLSNEIRDVMPGTALILTFDVDEWAHITSGTGTITHYFAP
ncbi:histidine phosphatase family protein [Mucilaginibacter sp. Bleaf8]|uniref:SixA phosphatase family protein n=1 Tax=Mucilaginibacter sp. Bleaf8 TaxID=2834430 RepID=UPI001BCFB2E1|nr:histidine phosphatase family protein [Mucilaginibacter sp. Bleaf8]MBS7563547.1 histidine phosphatase family protein [Mucilaginibacter sp. Bleaf8]